MKRIALGILVALALAAPVAAQGKWGTGTVTLDQPAPHYGDVITFTVTTTADASVISLACTQNGAIVLTGGGLIRSAGTYTSDQYGLASGAYTGGAADCMASLESYAKYGRHHTIASLAFSIAP